MGCPYYTLPYLCVGQVPHLIAWPEAAQLYGMALQDQG